MIKFFLMAFLPLCIYAEDLKQLVDLALQNQLVQASQHKLESAKHRSDSVQNSYMPSLSIGANQSFNQEETITSPDKSSTAYAKLSFSIYDGGKRSALIDQQEALVNQATFALQSTQSAVTLNVIYTYYAYLSTLANKEAIEQKIEQLKAEKHRLDKYLSVGSATEDELQKIISSIEQANVQLLQSTLALSNLSNTLEYLTGKTVSVEKGSTLKLEAQNKSERYDILALEAAAKSSQFQAKIAKAPSYPSITLEDTYSRFNNDYNTLVSTGIDRQNTLALNVQWKIFDFGSTNDAYESARKEYLAQQSQLTYEKQKANASLQNARYSYEIAQHKVSASKARLQASSLTYELVLKKFQNGIVNNVVYLDALSDKYSAISELQTALNEVEYQKAVVLYEMGNDIKGSIQ